MLERLIVSSFTSYWERERPRPQMSEANSPARLRRVADEDVRAPSKNLQLTTRNFLGYRFEAFDELLESFV
jgi:hypothetical protein